MANDPSIAEVQWKEPPSPPHGSGSAKWPRIADQLRSRPGEWALVAENVSTSTVQNIRRGACAGMPVGEFQAMSRANGYEKGRADIYARYIGGES